jgi:hypothetical protein
MDASNQDRSRTTKYSAHADGLVRKDSLGRFIEEFEWSDLVQNGRPLPLPAHTLSVRQQLTLEPTLVLQPNLARTDPRLIGPILDLFTFYVDLWLAAKMPLARAGDHVRFPRNAPSSWADGQSIIVGQDAVDFDITLVSLDSASSLARLRVLHVPPAAQSIQFPASWMRTPLFDTPNNWLQVAKASDTGYVAGVGRETFAVDLAVSLADGRIVDATMDNPVDLEERVCRDAALTACGAPYRYRILRRIALRAR